MGDELHREHSPMEGPDPGAQDAAPLASHSPGCSREHGLREGACSAEGDPGGTRPDRATRYLETTLGILSYAQLAPLLAERVARVEAALLKEEFDSLPLDEFLVLDLHARICRDLTPDWAGTWRKVSVTVGSLTPPEPHQIPILMHDYGLDLQARWADAIGSNLKLTFEFLAFAEGRFLTIHPFRDFNGRTIRVFLLELLRRLDFPRVELAPQTELGRACYFSALEAADRFDWQPLMAIWESRFSSIP